MTENRWRWLTHWPWLILCLILGAAFWHTLDFPDDPDDEYPAVVRPNFSRRPPPAYRLAEPGDTLDRMAIYFSSGAVVFALIGWSLNRKNAGLWPVALGLSVAGLWHAATPGPTFDGWHGLGFRAILDPSATLGERLALAAGTLGIGAVVLRTLWKQRGRTRELWSAARALGVAGLLIAAQVCTLARQFEIPGVEPVGYWPRWFLDLGLLAFAMVLVRCLPSLQGRYLWLRGAALTLTAAGVWLALVVGGIWLTWFHRPIARLREIDPGKVYICAMPTGRGLEIAHARHHFKTIINLFPEDTPFRSPHLPDELRFAETHGVHYVGATSDPAEADAFLDRTLALARDPDAWPILIHCHACQDRTPAWWGIYRFVVKNEPLSDIMRDIERHRGWRPKASVTLLYNHVLSPRAPEHYRNDPTADLLRRCAENCRDPYSSMVDLDGLPLNRARVPRVSRRTDLDRALPNLTPRAGSLEYQQTLRDRAPHDSAPTP